MSVEAELEKLGLLRGKYPKPMKLGLCSRSHDIIEPMIMPQWFVDCTDMAARSVAAVREKRLNIRPEFHEKTWYQWLENIRPWCVSRQLWWGHRIPAYFASLKSEGELDQNAEQYAERWIVARSEDQARERAAKLLKCKPQDVRRPFEISRPSDLRQTAKLRGTTGGDGASTCDRHALASYVSTHCWVLFWAFVVCIAGRLGGVGAGPGRFGHVVQQRPLPLLHHGLARRHARHAGLLSQLPARVSPNMRTAPRDPSRRLTLLLFNPDCPGEGAKEEE